MSFYLKYRPQLFSDIVGQTHIKQTLLNAICDNQLVHAYLFCGSRGTGKTSTARILAKAINCINRNTNGEPCNKCSICEQTNTGNLVDLIEIDAASNRGIDEIRELKEKIQFSPTTAKKKIFIIDEVHMLTKEAFNAMLKTLEEPPLHAYFVLATTESHKIPETIVSRCQQFNFKRIDEKDIIERLKFIGDNEDIDAEDEALKLIARQANGGLRDAISIFEQLGSDKKISYDEARKNLGIVGHQFHEEFYSSLDNIKLAFNKLEELNTQGYDLAKFNQEFLFFLREKMLENLDSKEDLNNIIQMINNFTKSKEEIKSAIIPQLPIEIAIIKGSKEYATDKVLNYPDDTDTSKEEKNSTKLKEKDIEEEVENNNNILDKKEDNSNKLKDKQNISTIKQELTLELLNNNWERILEHIKTPFIKISLKDSIADKVESNIVTLKFKSQFHMAKINESKNKIEVLKAIEEVLDHKVKIETKIGVVDESKINKKDNKESNNKESIQDMIKEIFG